jgi:hypothetical protein
MFEEHNAYVKCPCGMETETVRKKEFVDAAFAASEIWNKRFQAPKRQES